jgi:hypothetical protein
MWIMMPGERLGCSAGRERRYSSGDGYET